MITADVLELIDYPDLDARLLAAGAVEELPDVTPLLVLADRFAELSDHDRERAARRLAVGIVGPVGTMPGCGACTLPRSSITSPTRSRTSPRRSRS